MTNISRRKAIAALTSVAASSLISPGLANVPVVNNTRQIPKTGESIPVIGMGSWITFNVGNDVAERLKRTEVLKTFFRLGGGMIDSSPMYGSSEEVIGYGLQKLGQQPTLFSATKVWTPLSFYGDVQIKNSHKLWGLDKFDLLQVHNLLSWQSHLDKLLQMKADKKLRYVGVTTSHGLKHNEMEKIIMTQPIDFVQFTYNILDREAESRLLPIAKEHKIGVIINRPFRRGGLFDKFQKKPLPNWIKEFDCKNWAQFFLKFIISHPSVTCTIPATSRVDHMKENMEAGTGRLPSPKMRQRMVQYVAGL